MEKYFVIENDTITSCNTQDEMLEFVKDLLDHNYELSKHDFERDSSLSYNSNIVIIKGNTVKLGTKLIVK